MELDYSQIENLRLVINELELQGIKFNLDILDRAIYKNKIVYILSKNGKIKIYCKKERKIYEIDNKKDLLPFPILEQVIELFPIKKNNTKFEAFLTFIKEKKLEQNLVILALNYLLCIKKNSIGINGVLIDCDKKDNNNKTKKRKKL